MPNHHKHLHERLLKDAMNGFVGQVTKVGDEPNAVIQGRAPNTVFQTVYTTLKPTFDGPIAGYTTVGKIDDAAASPTTLIKADPTTTAKAEVTAAAAAAVNAETSSQRTQVLQETNTLPDSIIAPTATSGIDEDATLAVATSPTLTKTKATQALETTSAATSAAASASSTAEATSDSTETSGAAKAGIAIGILGGLLVVGLIIFFLFNKRKREMAKQKAAEDEKAAARFNARPDSVLTTRTTATAPQLSLRPVTQFMPTFSERRSSKGAALALATGSAGAKQQNGAREMGANAWERPSTSRANDHENPFGNHAERAQTPTGNEPRNPFNAPENVVGMAQTIDSRPSTPNAMVAGAGAAVVANAALARKASTRKEGPAPLDLTRQATPPSPAGTEFSINSVAPGQSPGPSKSAAAIAEAGGPPASVVHRVTLDFKPTLQDELGLRCGQLVRLLHEYDDGWALCIRLDRSQQGVVPRTCLSTRPVKPRPAGGPPGARPGPPVNPNGNRGSPRGPPRGPGPNQRPMTPQGGPHGRPQSPATMRPYSPAGSRPMSPYGSRPASPVTGRSMSPGPQPQSPGSRPQSPSMMNRRHTPPGPSPMNPNSDASYSPPQSRSPPQGPVGRKPVPGQAY